MNRRALRISTGTLALLALTVLGDCAHQKPFATLGSDYGATVNSASAVSPETIPVSQSRGDVVHWATSPPFHRLKIVFRAKDFPAEAKGEPPFPGPNNVDLILYSSGGTIYSGPANPKLKALFDANANLLLNYTYDQTYDAVVSDGRIIIMK